MILFSPSSGGFFDTAIHLLDAIPADAVEISAGEHARLMEAQSAGLIITPTMDGLPVALDPPPPSAESLFAALRTQRDARLNAALAILDRHRNQVDFGLRPTLTTEQATAWAVYAQALRDLPARTADPASPEWPELPAATPTEGLSE